MATATKTRLRLEDYVGHSFHPDCDLVDGRLEERNLGELEHSEVQVAIVAWFLRHAREWSIKVLSEMRVQTSATHFRVADVAIISRDAPRESILQTPPLIVIEVLSPEDRRERYAARIEDYRNMGVAHVWVVDSISREGFDCSAGEWTPVTEFVIAGSPIGMAIAELDLPV